MPSEVPPIVIGTSKIARIDGMPGGKARGGLLSTIDSTDNRGEGRKGSPKLILGNSRRSPILPEEKLSKPQERS